MVPNLSQLHSKQTPLLTKLSLLSNHIGENGAKFISTALQTNSSLTELGLSSNYIGVNGARFISPALSTKLLLN